MDNYKKAILEILELALNAPELNMGNYDEEQVRELNNAMIGIYQTAFSAKENSPNEIAALHLHNVSKAKRALIAKLEELDLNYIADQNAHELLADEMLEAINDY